MQIILTFIQRWVDHIKRNWSIIIQVGILCLLIYWIYEIFIIHETLDEIYYLNTEIGIDLHDIKEEIIPNNDSPFKQKLYIK